MHRIWHDATQTDSVKGIDMFFHGRLFDILSKMQNASHVLFV